MRQTVFIDPVHVKNSMAPKFRVQIVVGLCLYERSVRAQTTVSVYYIKME